MAAIPTNITSLDYEARLASLKNYLKTNTEFKDFDFEGSTMNYLLKVLAFNSYQDSFLLNMVANESFIDSAQLRENLVSKAKALNYLPKSAKSSQMQLRLVFNPTDDPQTIIIPRGARFYNTVDGVTYNFVTLQDYVVNKNGNTYERIVTVYDGNLLPATRVYNSVTGAVKFELPNDNIDTSTLLVTSKDYPESTIITGWNVIDDITEVDSTTYGFFVEEDIQNRYVIFFGDGVLGRKPLDGTIFTIEHLVTYAGKANGITSVYVDGLIGYNNTNLNSRYQPTLVQTIEAASGGSAKEDIESIRFNAPRNYERQNRLVTKTDYINFIKEKYRDLQSISFWGGEDNDPPIYGRVFLSVKPLNGYTVTQGRKEDIVAACRKYNIQTIEPIVVDPIFVYVNPSIVVRYNPNATTLSSDQIHTKVADKIRAYELNDLGQFNSDFRFSEFVAMIDDTDISIISNETSMRIEKRFTPVLNSTVNYIIKFNRGLMYPYEGYKGVLTSSAFRTPYINQDTFIEDDGMGKVKMYYFNNSEKTYLNVDAGSINYTTGELSLKELLVMSYEGEEIRIRVEPLEKDIVPDKNEIILISSPKMSIYDNKLKAFTFTSSFDTEGTVTSVYDDISSNIVYT